MKQFKYILPALGCVCCVFATALTSCADEWDDQQADYVRKYYSGAAQFRAYQSVYALTGPSASQPTYITKCDEYQQFRKYYTKHKTGI